VDRHGGGVGYRFAGEIEGAEPTSPHRRFGRRWLFKPFVDVTGEQSGVRLAAGVTERRSWSCAL